MEIRASSVKAINEVSLVGIYFLGISCDLWIVVASKSFRIESHEVLKRLLFKPEVRKMKKSLAATQKAAQSDIKVK